MFIWAKLNYYEKCGKPNKILAYWFKNESSVEGDGCKKTKHGDELPTARHMTAQFDTFNQPL